MNNEDKETQMKDYEQELRELIRKLKMLKIVYISIITILSIGALIWALVDYSTYLHHDLHPKSETNKPARQQIYHGYEGTGLPVVAFNQDGQCVYIDTERGRQDCSVIPSRYIKEQVK